MHTRMHIHMQAYTHVLTPTYIHTHWHRSFRQFDHLT